MSGITCVKCGNVTPATGPNLGSIPRCATCGEPLPVAAPRPKTTRRAVRPESDVRILDSSPGAGKLPWKIIGAAGGGLLLLILVLVFALGGSDDQPQRYKAFAPSTAPEPKQARMTPEAPKADPAAPKSAAPVRAAESTPKPRPAPVPKKPAPVTLSTRESRRQLDHQLYVINLAGIAAAYCDRTGKAAQGAKLRSMMKDTRTKLDALVARLRNEGQNPYIDDTLQVSDTLTWFENQKLKDLGPEKSAALLGTFVAKVRGGSKARVAVVRAGEEKEFVIRFDERPTELLTIIQMLDLIPGQTVVAKNSAAPKPGASAPKTAAAPPKAPPPPPPPAVPAPVAPVPAPAAAKPPKKPAPPSAGDQRDATSGIRDLFQEEYARKTEAGRRELARKLLAGAEQSEDEPVVRYVMLKEACDLAVEAGDIETAVGAVDEMDAVFEIDALDMKATMLGKIASRTRKPEQAAKIARAYLKISYEAQDFGEYDLAASVTGKAESAARAARNRTLLEECRKAKAEASAIRLEASKVKRYRKTLETKPDDPRANLSVGRFLCFVVGEWPKGLLHLSKGSDPALKRAALSDLAAPADSAGQIVLGDVWWNLAQKERKKDTRSAVEGRARFWYEQGVVDATGLVKMRVEKRLKAAEPEAPAGTVDLMPLVDVRRDAVLGVWKKEGSGFANEKRAGGTRLMIPYAPSDEYDLVAEIERRSPGEITMGLVSSGRQFVITLAPLRGVAGIGRVDRIHFLQNESLSRGVTMPVNQRVRVVYSIRKGRVGLTVGGQKIIDWQGPASRLDLNPIFSIPNSRALFVGSGMDAHFAVHKLEIVPVSGAGRRLR